MQSRNGYIKTNFQGHKINVSVLSSAIQKRNCQAAPCLTSRERSDRRFTI